MPMSRARRSSMISRVLIAVALTLGLAAVAAASVKSGSYSGTTKQKQKITFTLAKGSVSSVAFKINDTCPDKHILRVTVGPKYFPALRLDSKGNFSASVHPPNASNQPTSIKGTIKGKSATGSITDTTMSSKEHKLCHGHTTFAAKTK
jgi:hypothetical protein